MLENMTKYEQAEWLAKLQGFTSLAELYKQAMSEAESYYERPNGYEEFKAKYPCYIIQKREMTMVLICH